MITQNHSYVEVTNSNFMNNTVRYGLMTVLNSGTLVMSDCSVLRNWAKHTAILAKKVWCTSQILILMTTRQLKQEQSLMQKLIPFCMYKLYFS